MFPIIASITLFSLFLVFKYLDSKWINQILGGYCKREPCRHTDTRQLRHGIAGTVALASVLAFQFVSICIRLDMLIRHPLTKMICVQTFTYILKGAWTRLLAQPHVKYHFRIEKGYKRQYSGSPDRNELLKSLAFACRIGSCSPDSYFTCRHPIFYHIANHLHIPGQALVHHQYPVILLCCI
jgi:hypothetical protein